MRLNLAESDLLGGGGVDEPLQFVWVVNIGHEALGHFRNGCRQRHTIDETAAESKTVNRMITKPPSYHVPEQPAAGT